jgi:proteic killer suppression protein
MIAAVAKMETLKISPNKKLERLRGVREGLWSIRINDHWRICFRRQNGSAHDVEISDYHSGEVMK